MSITRRHFLAGAVSAAGVALGAEGAARPILDTHIHVWDMAALNPAWLAKAEPVLRKRFMGEEYRAATAGWNVTQAVYVEIAESNERRGAEAEFVLELIRSGKTPIVAAVIGGDPAAEGFADHVRRFAQAAEIKGVRCFYRAGCESNPKFVAGVRLLGELGMSFDLVHGGDLLAGAAGLVKQCPNTTFILDHCAYGNPDWFDAEAKKDAAISGRREMWERGIAALAQNPKVACKISGVAEQSRRPVTPQRLAPVVRHCIEQFGEDRVMFGSNWPVCLKAIPLAQWAEAVKRITAGRGEGFERKLFWENGRKRYRIVQ